MIWKKCSLLDKTISGQDKLGNPIESLVSVLNVSCRQTPYDSIDNLLENRIVTKDEQFFTLPIRFALLPTFSHIELDGNIFEVVEVIDLPPRYVVVGGKIYENQD